MLRNEKHRVFPSHLTLRQVDADGNERDANVQLFGELVTLMEARVDADVATRAMLHENWQQRTRRVHVERMASELAHAFHSAEHAAEHDEEVLWGGPYSRKLVGPRV